MKTILRFLFALLFATGAYAEDDLSKKSADALIDELAQIDSPTIGLHGSAAVVGFIADGKPLRFGGGVLGSVAPETTPQMCELAKRGITVLPNLIKRLSDKTPTKLTVGGEFFMFQEYSNEYDPKSLTENEVESKERSFRGKYTVKIGDVCFALIGQIVNRNFLPVRYQPTAGLIINSPCETPELIDRVKKDWADVTENTLRDSLIVDAKEKKRFFRSVGAFSRLEFYYPDDFKKLIAAELKEPYEKVEGFLKTLPTAPPKKETKQ